MAAAGASVNRRACISTGAPKAAGPAQTVSVQPALPGGHLAAVAHNWHLGLLLSEQAWGGPGMVTW